MNGKYDKGPTKVTPPAGALAATGSPPPTRYLFDYPLTARVATNSGRQPWTPPGQIVPAHHPIDA